MNFHPGGDGGERTQEEAGGVTLGPYQFMVRVFLSLVPSVRRNVGKEGYYPWINSWGRKRLVTPRASPRGCLCSGRREFTSGSSVPWLQWQSHTLLLLAGVTLKDGGQHTCKPRPRGAQLGDKVTKCPRQKLCAGWTPSHFSARNHNSIATWCA